MIFKLIYLFVPHRTLSVTNHFADTGFFKSHLILTSSVRCLELSIINLRAIWVELLDRWVHLFCVRQ